MTPDPLAELLAVVIDGWFSDGEETWRLVPMTADGGLSVTSPASWFAEAIAARLRDAGVVMSAEIDVEGLAEAIDSLPGFSYALYRDDGTLASVTEVSAAILAAARENKP